MTLGAIDNGFLVHVGERFAGYIAYSSWSATKHVPVDGRNLFGVLRELFYEGGNAGEYAKAFKEARDYVAANLGLLDDAHSNPYVYYPLGRVRLHEGRLGTVWGLYEALCHICDLCDRLPGATLYVERIAENCDWYS